MADSVQKGYTEGMENENDVTIENLVARLEILRDAVSALDDFIGEYRAKFPAE